jgi:hypothetical protein
VGEHAAGQVTVTDQHCITKREAGHRWPEQAGLDCSGVQFRIGREWQAIDQHDADVLGSLHANRSCVRHAQGVQRPAPHDDVRSHGFSPGDSLW